MTAIELFAGIGGFRLGLERAGFDIIYANEWDKYAADTYDKNFTNHKINRRDITTIDVSSIPDHDLLVGGFPCQAFSVAGKRRGFQETRGTLFFDVARILADKRPGHLVLENVKGLLNHDDGKTFQTILGVLSELGYDTEWQLFNSKGWGVPQRRERIYIVGHLRERCGSKILPVGIENQGTPPVSNDATQGTKKFIKTRHLSQNGGLISDSITLQASEIPHLLDIAYPGREPRSFRDYAPTVRDYGSGGNKMPMVVSDARIRRLTPKECERLQGFPDDWTAGVSDTQRYKQCGNAVTVNVVEAAARRLADVCYNQG